MDSLFFSPLKNVDAVAAKELMAYLVKLQSDLTEVNKYASRATFKICGAKFSWCSVVAFLISLKIPSQCSYSRLCTHVTKCCTHVTICVCSLYVHVVKHICLSLVSVPLLWMARGLRY